MLFYLEDNNYGLPKSLFNGHLEAGGVENCGSIRPAMNETMSYGWGDFPLYGDIENQVPTATVEGTKTTSTPSTEPEESIVDHPVSIPLAGSIHNGGTDVLAICCSSNAFKIHGNEELSSSKSCNDVLTQKVEEKRRQRRRRNVQFSSVQIQEYSLTLGNHPVCGGPFPLTLDWCHSAPTDICINEYEVVRQNKVEERGSSDMIKLSSCERRVRLRKVTGLKDGALYRMELERIRGGNQDVTTP